MGSRGARAPERAEDFVNPLKSHPGTVVFWWHLDLSRFPRTASRKGSAGPLEGGRSLGQHLGMVFHRFLEGDLPGSRRSLVITLNGNKSIHGTLSPRTRITTQRLKLRDFDIAANGVAGVVSFEPLVLPSQVASPRSSVQPTIGTPNVEPTARLLHLSCQSHDSIRWMVELRRPTNIRNWRA